MADWKDGLLPASYRGQPFGVIDTTSEFGRRLAVHELPQRERPIVQDLGESARRYNLAGFIVGDDLFARVDRMVKVCSGRGVSSPFLLGGILVHPYLGELRVACESLRVSFDRSAGRFARLSFSFVESGQALQVDRSPNTVEEADNAALEVADAGEAAALEDMTAKGPESVREATRAALSKLGDKLNSLDVFSGPAADVAELVADIDALTLDGIALAKSPALALAKVRRAVDRLRVTAGSAGRAWEAYAALTGYEPDSIGGGGSTGAAADLNGQAIGDLVKSLAVGGLARSGVRRTWEALEEAQAGRALVASTIDEALDTASDDAFTALGNLRAAVALAIPPPDQALAALQELVLERSAPALVVGYDLYGDADRGEEIATRNGVTHPGFMPGGVVLEVLAP